MAFKEASVVVRLSHKLNFHAIVKFVYNATAAALKLNELLCLDGKS